jgi:hypothetical protein
VGIKPESEVRVDMFGGMVSNKNPRDLKPGQAAIQINVTAVRHGELQVRRGLRELQFDVEDY